LIRGFHLIKAFDHIVDAQPEYNVKNSEFSQNVVRQNLKYSQIDIVKIKELLFIESQNRF